MENKYKVLPDQSNKALVLFLIVIFIMFSALLYMAYTSLNNFQSLDDLTNSVGNIFNSDEKENKDLNENFEMETKTNKSVSTEVNTYVEYDGKTKRVHIERKDVDGNVTIEEYEE